MIIMDQNVSSYSRSSERGWNDPPPASTGRERLDRSNIDATRKRLNKRVAIPMSTGITPVSVASMNSYSSQGPPKAGAFSLNPSPAGQSLPVGTSAASSLSLATERISSPEAFSNGVPPLPHNIQS
ncbi:uncharacterized protein LOC108670869 [Hyalella azteca]|uniref:Uncharacterized protein LOC108670869 n=1 Tax=Hyalella azteca TaxID=294128 RepID=A0A8B7NJM7_HYAAZ|nr:uncharacterized protein LOC108670869 [Hyalella azteca]